jgi:hypothetical protein
MLPNISNFDMYIDVLVNSISLCPVINTFLDSKYLLSGSICYVNSAQDISITGSACGHHPAHGDLQPPGLPFEDAGRRPQQPPEHAALQDPLHQRQLSCILNRLNRNFTELEVRRAFTVFQLMTIPTENHHSFLIVEHDPLPYEALKRLWSYVAQAMKQTSRRRPSCSTRRRWILTCGR